MRLACVPVSLATQGNEDSMVTDRSISDESDESDEPGAEERGKDSDSLIFDTLNPSA